MWHTEVGINHRIVEYSGSGTFCTTYQDTFSDMAGTLQNQTFSSYEGTGTVSPNGKWYVFASDWGSTLGTDTSGKIRDDTFVCRLR